MKRPVPRLRAEWWLVGVLLSGLVAFLAWDRTTARLDTLIYDQLSRLAEREPDSRIFLVTIDNEALQAFGPWPWPRPLQARLIDAVGSGRPKAIAYDVLLVDRGEADADARLAEAIEAAAAPVFVPLLIDRPGRNGADYEAVLPVPDVARAAAGVGHVNLVPDPDGLFRRVRLMEGDERRAWPHLMIWMQRAAEGAGVEAAASPADAPLLVPFAGPAGHFPSISASAVLRGELPRPFLEDKLVIVGATAEGLGDRHPTAPGDTGLMSGAEIQANILDALLAGRFISEASPAAVTAAGLVSIWLLLILFRVAPPRWALGGVALLAGAAILVSLVALIQLRTWIAPTPALAAIAIAYPLWGWRRLSTVSTYMVRQLDALRKEPDMLAGSSAGAAFDDPVSRQMRLLDEAIMQVRDMRRFIADTIQQLPDAVIVLDPDGAVLLANEAAVRLLADAGIDPEQATAEALLNRFTVMPPADEQLLWPPPPEGTMLEARGPEDRYFDLQLSVRRDGDGKRIGWTLRLRDVTEVVRARLQREETLHFLSHDMRSPQASILAVLSTARPGELAGGLAAKIEGYARKTLALADGFIHLARAEMPRYRLEVVNLSDLLVDAVDEIWPRAAAKQVSVRLSGEEGEWPVRAERSLLTRALVNLLDNAVKFSPPGSSISCALGADGPSAGRRVRCVIADEGEGIAPELLCTLFERFESGRSPGGPAQGVGLGLAFVATVIARHGGTIECGNAEDGGAEFTIRLPLHQDEGTPEAGS